MFLVMDAAAGGDLCARLRGGPMEPRDAARMVEALARGLHHAHEHGVLHRDVKSANVVFSEDGTPKLVDFGLARLAGGDGQSLTQTGELMGSPAYMAPEQARGERHAVGVHTDVYGLGAVLYEALTSRPPFAGAVVQVLYQVVSEAPVPPRTLIPTIPAAIERVCLHAMAKAPKDRPASALALAEELVAALDSPGERTAPWASLLAALAMCLALGVAVGFALGMMRNASFPAPSPNGSPAPAPEQPPAVAVNPPWAAYGSDAPLPEVFFPEADDIALASPYEGEEEPVARNRWQALRGEVGPMAELAFRLRTGRHVKRNRRLALGWFVRAADKGRPELWTEAGRILRQESGVRDFKRAAVLFTKRAREGEALAVFHLAEMLARGEWFERDPEAAAAWLEASVAGGTKRGAVLVLLGELLLVGDGVVADVARARALFTRAASGRGGVLGLVRLGEMAWRGQGEVRDLDRAERLFRKAAEHESAWGMIRLGELLEERDGADPRRWFSQATESGGGPGSSEARFRVFLETSKDVAGGQQAGSAQLLRRAAGAEHVGAMVLLADQCGDKDPERARRLLQAAGALGDPAAIERLIQLEPERADHWKRRAALAVSPRRPRR
jgi:TPR repeat protein